MKNDIVGKHGGYRHSHCGNLVLGIERHLQPDLKLKENDFCKY